MMEDDNQSQSGAEEGTEERTHDKTDFVWGASAIGNEIDRTASQVHYLHAKGVLKGSVRKLSHKILVGSRRELRKLVLG